MIAAELFIEDPRAELEAMGLWAGRRSYDDGVKAWLAKSGHYLEAPPPGAILAVSLETLTGGLFGKVPSGDMRGLVVIGRPTARNLPQDGTWGDAARIVLVERIHRVASLLLRVAAEAFARIARAEVLIAYHDRTRHSGCIYRKAGFRKFGVTRPGTRRGTWGSRPGREQGVSSEAPSKRRWRLDLADVRAGVAARCAA